jgi:hypothetical protein
MLFGEKGKFSLLSGFQAYWFHGLVEFFPGGEWGVPSLGSAVWCRRLENGTTPSTSASSATA